MVIYEDARKPDSRALIRAEDAGFSRDLSWIKDELLSVYQAGKESAQPQGDDAQTADEIIADFSPLLRTDLPDALERRKQAITSALASARATGAAEERDMIGIGNRLVEYIEADFRGDNTVSSNEIFTVIRQWKAAIKGAG